MLPFFMPITLHSARVNPLFQALHWREEEP
ncbi:Uncharacterised protein [Klebsiella pneumoniae]|uniref:Uncharacterized protein n=1 Tax=Klebsiella pneumoniae TaxID=573 RepID=A0A378H3B9_KLEPN|nr:Uncharacterised protein [Klebsiella pneumoniae]STR79272.1 Uncharacterised protein [Klebsiella pneumoniae]STR81588.1 Uncharacterised protein [Klebsiella pneumoniae]STR92219.1 Uncharacterised protein [Klebsiella pneumoniae]STS02590.1 Uncharacterised protein [Klebsiella pneumoniae]